MDAKKRSGAGAAGSWRATPSVLGGEQMLFAGVVKGIAVAPTEDDPDPISQNLEVAKGMATQTS